HSECSCSVDDACRIRFLFNQPVIKPQETLEDLKWRPSIEPLPQGKLDWSLASSQSLWLKLSQPLALSTKYIIKGTNLFSNKLRGGEFGVVCLQRCVERYAVSKGTQSALSDILMQDYLHEL